MSGNIIEHDGSIASLRPMLHFGDRGNPIPEGMLPPEAMPYENSLDIGLALDFFVERVRGLEAENRELRERVRELEEEGRTLGERLCETEHDLTEALDKKEELEGRIAELTQENSNQKRVIQMLEYRVLALKGKPIPMEPRSFIPSSNRSNAKEAGE